jgi:hypothetical protein
LQAPLELPHRHLAGSHQPDGRPDADRRDMAASYHQSRWHRGRPSRLVVEFYFYIFRIAVTLARSLSKQGFKAVPLGKLL